MSNRKFTAKEVEELRKNPNTYRATENTLSFTKEFKELFFKEHQQGKTTRQILRENGYSPEMLGNGRIDGFVSCVNRQFRLYGEFHDAPLKPEAAVEKTGEARTPEEEIRVLRGEVEYLKQEMEFLKKISSIRTTKG